MPDFRQCYLCSHDDVIKWNHFRLTGPLCGEFTGHRWIPSTKASDAELFSNLCLNKGLGKHSWGWWFETPSRPLRRHCNAPTHVDKFLLLHSGYSIMSHGFYLSCYLTPDLPTLDNCRYQTHKTKYYESFYSWYRNTSWYHLIYWIWISPLNIAKKSNYIWKRKSTRYLMTLRFNNLFIHHAYPVIYISHKKHNIIVPQMVCVILIMSTIHSCSTQARIFV